METYKLVAQCLFKEILIGFYIVYLLHAGDRLFQTLRRITCCKHRVLVIGEIFIVSIIVLGIYDYLTITLTNFMIIIKD